MVNSGSPINSQMKSHFLYITAIDLATMGFEKYQPATGIQVLAINYTTAEIRDRWKIIPKSYLGTSRARRNEISFFLYNSKGFGNHGFWKTFNLHKYLLQKVFRYGMIELTNKNERRIVE